MSDTHKDKDGANQYYRDKVLACNDCKEEFVWVWQDQRDLILKEKELKKDRPDLKLNPPQICPICRRKRRKEDEKVAQVRAKQEQRMRDAIRQERAQDSIGVGEGRTVTIETQVEMTMMKQHIIG